VIILPPNQPADERNAFLAEIEARYGDYIRREIARRHGVAPGSRDDVRQNVLLILCDQLDKGKEAGKPGPLEKGPKYIHTVVDNAVRNHTAKKARRPQTDAGAEVDEAATSAPSPEQAVAHAELCAKLERYRAQLTKEEEEVLHAREILGLSFEEIAEQLGRSRATVFSQHTRAVEKLRDMATASERAATHRAKRRPNP
jgi:RNA polymerase sigma-70 factor (ECF subfamily)